MQIADAREDTFHELVDAEGLADEIVDFRKEGVLRVGGKDLCPPLRLGGEKSRLFETVEFHPHGVGGLAELVGKLPEVAAGLGVQKELAQKLDTGF